VVPVGDDLVEAYVSGAVEVVPGAGSGGAAAGGEGPGLVYTPLHGVGRDVVLAVFARAGFPAPRVVPAQAEPDPDFPTVSFPNPEEPGALDLALAEARRVGADAIVANDPDADRLAVALPVPPPPGAGADAGGAGGWRPLTGDETGIVLADWLLSRGSGADRLVVTSVVSSSMLSRLAAARGVAFAETLTGFKWIARAALDRPELRFVFGYEEALGSCVGTLVRDKDGITAALAFARLVADERSRGRSVLDRLDDLARELGVHATRQRSIRITGTDGLTRMQAAVDRLATAPPGTIAGHAVAEVEDLRRGDRLPPTDGVVLRGGDVRLIVRPSGTEPKLKCYAEAVVPARPGTDLPGARRQADATVTALLEDAVALVGP
jgi:phosphomannomutase